MVQTDPEFKRLWAEYLGKKAKPVTDKPELTVITKTAKPKVNYHDNRPKSIGLGKTLPREIELLPTDKMKKSVWEM